MLDERRREFIVLVGAAGLLLARDLEAALAALIQQKISAFAVTADSFLFSRLNEIVAFAGLNHLPTMGVERQFTLIGGLMAYGPDSGDAFRQGGVYTGRSDRVAPRLLHRICRGVADFVAEVAQKESSRWRPVINLRWHSPVRAVAGDYSNDCQRDFGMT